MLNETKQLSPASVFIQENRLFGPAEEQPPCKGMSALTPSSNQQTFVLYENCITWNLVLFQPIHWCIFPGDRHHLFYTSSKQQFRRVWYVAPKRHFSTGACNIHFDFISIPLTIVKKAFFKKEISPKMLILLLYIHIYSTSAAVIRWLSKHTAGFFFASDQLQHDFANTI